MDFAFKEDQEQLRSINQRFFENAYPLARLEIPKAIRESKRKILWDNAVRFYKFEERQPHA